MKRILALATAALTIGATQAQAQAQAQQALAFVTCPMMRDTATVPCWLAEYKGELYYLGAQGDGGVSPPSLGHQALIEGVATAETRCGGKVLTDLHVSIRPERNVACDVIIPQSDKFQIGDPKGSGAATAGPSSAPPPPPRPEGSLSRRFEIFYDFDWQTAGRETAIIQEAVAYAKANPIGEIHVTGYRASVQLTGGGVLDESEGIDMRRAVELVEILNASGIGLGNPPIFTKDNPDPEPGDYTRRRAIIDVIFGGSDDHSEH